VKVYIMRGPSHSGKTTLANKLAKDHAREGGLVLYLSADAHRPVVDGKIAFDAESGRLAHDAVFKAFLACARGDNPPDPPSLVVVDNANTRAWELAPFVRICEVLGWDYTIMRLLTPAKLCIERSLTPTPTGRPAKIVPAEVIQRQQSQMLIEQLPPWWKQQDVGGM
jgi:tRNA uridine 5-carbamoylmethylation protein Kti12